ncbi:lysophospholipid acyltransferase family protein [Oligoflexus tunisiensis]|uniref:lysophospholipid acyltransferase family protein n=1 Tax=Oligoflexus tunisiensis TaxID=708132 RepID=UPI000AC71EB9|nr:lysophospholipid acyltransferase family protein [Oligoflexus tunisiensis]
MDEEFTLKLLPVMNALRVYHRHEVHGLENVPRRGPVIVACNHSLATYDMLMLMAAVYCHNGRLPRSLIDRAFYVFPGLGELMEKLGAIVGSQEAASSLLRNGEMLYLAPGGMRESLRPYTERYQILWNRRRGFARLSLETGVPIVLAACPRADDIYKVYDSPLTKLIYKKLRLPFFMARGLGPTAIPRPVKLEHFLSKPIYPPKPADDPASYKRQLYNYHRKLMDKMNAMIAEGIVPAQKSLF